jgi:dihydrofolate reductase
MGRLTLDITMSLGGFIAGRNRTVEQPLGEGGDRLHEWAVGLAIWRERHGLSGGTENADAEIVKESLDATGAVVMGRRMFSGAEGAWEHDPVAHRWWGHAPQVPRREVTANCVLVSDSWGPSAERTSQRLVGAAASARRWPGRKGSGTRPRRGSARRA